MTQARHKLKDILENLDPKILQSEFIFMSSNGDLIELIKALDPIGFFKEKEGNTLVISKELADKFNVEYDSVFSCISLGVNSSLDSFGLISTISRELTKNEISSNVFSGFYHDHIFVQADKAYKALKVIESIKHP